MDTTSPIKTSDEVDRLLASLAVVRANLKPITKDTPNPAYRGVMYAALPSILEIVEPLLAANGLLLMTWMADGGPGRAALAVRLYHIETGQWMECVAATDLGKADPQGTGGAVTYMRRYALCAIGVVTEVDDDGNNASGVGRTHGQRADDRPDPRPAARPASNGKATVARKGATTSDDSDIPF